jgi:hypothetical protein
MNPWHNLQCNYLGKSSPSLKAGTTKLGKATGFFLCVVVTAIQLSDEKCFAEKMTFHSRSIGGNTAGSEWIAAEGEISDDTAEDLYSYLNKEYSFDKRPVAWDIRLNSPGGSLIGGIRLGEWIRNHRFESEVGTSVPGGPGWWKRGPGICASACAFAFIGGVARDAGPGEIGVHQFYDQVSLRDPSAKMFNAIDLSAQQLVSAILIDYTYRMGVDPRFVSIAASTSPGNMHFLNELELDELKVRWKPKEFEPWAIEPSGRGVIAFTKTRDKSVTAALFCRQDRIPRLFIRPDSSDLSWYEQAMTVVSAPVGALGLNLPKEAIALKNVGGSPALEFTLRGFDPKTVGGSSLGTGVEGPRYIWPGFSFDLPRKNAEVAMSIALKNCL